MQAVKRDDHIDPRDRAVAGRSRIEGIARFRGEIGDVPGPEFVEECGHFSQIAAPGNL